MNKSVNFEIAKLLKEKGINLLSSKLMYASNGKLTDSIYDFDEWCFAPTIAEVVMWLYEKHEIWIISSYELAEDNITKEWFWIAIKDGEEVAFNYGGYTSPTEAYEAAITYCLNNLI